MDKFITRTKRVRIEVPHSQNPGPNNVETRETNSSVNGFHSQEESDLIIADPGKRPCITSVAHNATEREKIRRADLIKGPCQPKLRKFPQTDFSGINRRFNPEWYEEFKPWLEYNVSKDAAFCLVCNLFSIEYSDHRGGHDSFSTEGFRCWKKKEKLEKHVGLQNSCHNKCLKACADLMKQEQHIDIMVAKISKQEKLEYRVRLNASVECVRLLLMQALPFRGHDESELSNNQGNFRELLKFLCKHNKEAHIVCLDNAPKNHKLYAPSIQKDIYSTAAYLTTRAIIKDIIDDFFSILVDEACGCSIKEQMIVALRYVNKDGCIIERILGIVHVPETTSRVLKSAINSLFTTHGLSISRIHGQGFDEASNMSGHISGLKSLILAKNVSAFYVHFFAHQLQLTLVAVSKKHDKVCSFFDYLVSLVNFVGASCKRKELVRVKQIEKLAEEISQGNRMTDRGLNQEAVLKRPGDTRWGSHYHTILSVLSLFSPILDVLEKIKDMPSFHENKGEIYRLIEQMNDFEFIFLLHLMRKVLGITNELSQTLQRKDQDLANALSLVNVAKKMLQAFRDDGWNDLLADVSKFCERFEIDVPDMDAIFMPRGRSRRKLQKNSNEHYFKVSLLNTMIGYQLQEMNERFDKDNMELLLCISCLQPHNSFSAFDKHKLVQLTRFYPSEFDDIRLMALDDQLSNYIADMRSNADFQNLKGISDLAQKMVEKRKNITFSLVYMLIKLALILPVATATVEMGFYPIKLVKTTLRNQMRDMWLNDCLITYIERDVFQTVENDDIMKRFQNMKDSSDQDPPLAILPNNQHVAVKQITDEGYTETFLRELKSLSKVRHPNLVALLGYCRHKDECFLLYELCPNGNLSEWIFGKDKRLSWVHRLEIAIHCARGLWFLRNYPKGCIVHRDIKPTNILLGANFEARLSDFGLSKVIDIGETYKSSEVRGKFGYVNLEYQNTRRVDSAGDVYSFGVVLLQIISGRKVINMNMNTPMPLHKIAKSLTRNDNIRGFADPVLKGDYSEQAFSLTFKLSLSCTTRKKERSSMDKLTLKLEEALDISTTPRSLTLLTTPDWSASPT